MIEKPGPLSVYEETVYMTLVDLRNHTNLSSERLKIIIYFHHVAILIYFLMFDHLSNFDLYHILPLLNILPLKT